MHNKRNFKSKNEQKDINKFDIRLILQIIYCYINRISRMNPIISTLNLFINLFVTISVFEKKINNSIELKLFFIYMRNRNFVFIWEWKCIE